MEPLTFRASKQAITERKQMIKTIGLTMVVGYGIHYLASPLVLIASWTSLLIPCGLLFLFGWFVLPKVAERFSLKLLQESSAVLTKQGIEYQLGQQKEKISYERISSLLIQENTKGETVIVKVCGAGQMTLLLHSLEQMNQLAHELTKRIPDQKTVRTHRSIWNTRWAVVFALALAYGLFFLFWNTISADVIPLFALLGLTTAMFYRPFSKNLGYNFRFFETAFYLITMLVILSSHFITFSEQGVVSFDMCSLWGRYIQQSGCLYQLNKGGPVLTTTGAYPWVRMLGENIIFASPRTPVGIWTHHLPHPDDIMDFQVSENGATVASWSFDVSSSSRRFWVWDTISGSLLHEQGYSHLQMKLALSPDGRILALSQNGQIELRDVNSWEVQQTFRGGGQLAFSPNGRYLASGQQNNTVAVWDLVQGTKVATFAALTDTNSGITGIVFTPDSQQLVGVTINGEVLVWQVADGTLLHHWLEDGIIPVPVIAFSPDGRHLAVSFMGSAGVGPSSFYVNIWQLEDGQLAKNIQWEDRITSLDFSADGQLFVVSTLQETVVFRVSQFLP